MYPRDIRHRVPEAAVAAAVTAAEAAITAVAVITAAEAIISDNTPLTFVAVIKLIKDRIVF